MRIVLLGPPGAGKGTQAKVMAQRLALVHISTGDLLRQNVKDQTALGKEAKSYMDKGFLVPDELVAKMLMDRINKPDTAKGFILDGYPRTLNQAESLEKMLAQKNMGIDLVLYLDTSDKVIIQRLTGRRVCSSCNANYHVTNMPPKKENVCDSCGGALYQRTDDNEQTVRKRLDVYKQEVSSLITYYETRGKLRRLAADQEAGVVLDQIIDLVRDLDDSRKV